MIEIVYDRRRNALTCTGHANSAQAGRDIVCAACSMLVYGLAQAVSEICKGTKKKPDITLKSGNARIICYPNQKLKPAVEWMFWSYINGFKLLAANYGDFVKFIEK